MGAAFGGPTNVFVKRYRYDRLEQRIKQAFRGTLIGISRGRREYEFLNEMRRREVPTVRPIAYGDRYGLAFLHASFLITEGVEGFQSLDLFAINALRRKPLSKSERQELIEGLAAIIRQMHHAGVRHGGLYWRNILIRVPDSGGYEFLLIDPDTHGRFSDSRVPESDIVADMAEVVASAMALGQRAGLAPLMKAYLQVSRLTPEHKKLITKIVEGARALAPSERRRMAITEVIGWLRQRADAIGTDSQTAVSFDSVEDFFSEMTSSSDAPVRLSEAGKVIRFSFSGNDKAMNRTVTLDSGRATVSASRPTTQDLIIRTDPKTWLAVISGHPDAYPRLRAGRLRIEGDPTVLCTLMEHFDRRDSMSPTPKAKATTRPHAETPS